MSSIVLTRVHYVSVLYPSSYRLEPHYGMDGKLGYEVIATSHKNVFIDCSYPQPHYTFGLPSPIISTTNSGIPVQYGQYPTYNNCLHYGIEPSFEGHISLVDGILSQSDTTSSVGSVPYHYEHGPLPPNCYLSQGTPHQEEYYVRHGWESELMTSVWVFVTSTTSYSGATPMILSPGTVVTVVLKNGFNQFFTYSTTIPSEAREDALYVWVNHDWKPYTMERVLTYLRGISIIGTPCSYSTSDPLNDESVLRVRRWAESINLERLYPTLLDADRRTYPEESLARTAYESFRVKNASLLKELMDTMSDMAGLEKLSTFVKDLLPLKEIIGSTSIKEFMNKVSSLFLAEKYGIELPLKTLIAWSDVYNDLTTKLEKEIFPTALRSRENVSLERSPNLYGLSGNGYSVLTLGLTTFGDWRDYINGFYRWGLLLSVADGWDLVPLSFAIDWLWSGVQNAASAITAVLDSYRLSISYACRTSRLSLQWEIPGPITPILGRDLISIPVRYYSRVYSHNVPSLHLLSSFTQESSAGTLSISSLPQALALLVSFLT